jgi:hypothetical protein
MKMPHVKSNVLATIRRLKETDTRRKDDRKRTTYAEAWKHDVAIAGPQNDLPVLSSVHVVRIIKHVVRS